MNYGNGYDSNIMPPQYGGAAPQYGAPQYGAPVTSNASGEYSAFFQAGDFNRTGFLDVSGLQTALNAAGEQIDFDTAQSLMQTADQDGNGRVDYGGE